MTIYIHNMCTAIVLVHFVYGGDRRMSRRSSAPSESSSTSDMDDFLNKHKRLAFIEYEIDRTMGMIQLFQNEQRMIQDISHITRTLHQRNKQTFSSISKHDGLLTNEDDNYLEYLRQRREENDEELHRLHSQMNLLRADKMHFSRLSPQQHLETAITPVTPPTPVPGTVHTYLVPDANSSNQLISDLLHLHIHDAIICDFPPLNGSISSERINDVGTWHNYPLTQVLTRMKAFTTIRLNSAHDIREWILRYILAWHSNYFALNPPLEMIGNNIANQLLSSKQYL
eukprot:1121119_1